MILIIYLLGCLVAYPRLVASYYQIAEEAVSDIEPTMYKGMFLFLPLSWVAVVAGVFIYFIHAEEYFWKWSNSALWKRYNENNKP